MKPIKFDDERYSQDEYQEFRTFEEGERFLKDYCGKCRLRKPRCEMNYQLRVAMGENYPFFHPEFVRLTCFYHDNSALNTFESPEKSIIACKAFKPKQLEFAFV